MIWKEAGNYIRNPILCFYAPESFLSQKILRTIYGAIYTRGKHGWLGTAPHEAKVASSNLTPVPLQWVQKSLIRINGAIEMPCLNICILLYSNFPVKLLLVDRCFMLRIQDLWTRARHWFMVCMKLNLRSTYN